ncbi:MULTISPECIES: DUF4233 domain-containing protein [Oerskovia]|uniref:DUF4233 domain-containing protein n=1 Tax=Oerskovia TaxID=162491 RepID=UPI000AE96045|nr:DUF4233 domain-containing protein [Oerskovia sp. Root22]
MSSTNEPVDGSVASSAPTAEGAADAPRIKAKKSAKIQFTSTTLMLEAFLILFATLVAYGLRNVPYAWPDKMQVPSGPAIWIVGGTLIVVLLLLSRMVGGPGGYVAGSAVQIPVIACGFAVPLMFLVGGIFVVLWIVSLRLGGRIDRERAEYDAEHPETAPNM